MLVRIRRVEPMADRHVRLTFTTGEVGEVDLRPYLRGPVFQRIRDDDDYFARVFVLEEAGTIAWPNGADLDPDVLYNARLATTHS